MQERNDDREQERERRDGDAEPETRPQRAGEAATTRFGMDEGDNTDTPATGGPIEGEEAAERSS